MNMLEMRVVGVIRRRELLQRDPPVDFKAMIERWRKAGWSTSQICFVLNFTRGKLWHLESVPGSEPSHSDGQAMLKMDANIHG
jgi:hypothetical protein